MDDKPVKPPWEAELEAEVLAEEYAKRGESYSGSADELKSLPVDMTAGPPEPVEAQLIQTNRSRGSSVLSEEEEEELAKEFELEFLKERERAENRNSWLARFASSSEGRVIIITIIVCILFIVVGKLLSSTIASHNFPPPG